MSSIKIKPRGLCMVVITIMILLMFVGTGFSKQVKTPQGEMFARDVEITVPFYIQDPEELTVDMRTMIDTTATFRPGVNWLSLEAKGPSQCGLYFGYLYVTEMFQYAYNDYKVNFTSSALWTEPEKLLANIAAGTAPSAYYADVMGGVTSAAQKGIAADITEFWEKWPQKDKIPVRVLKEAQYKGRFYGFPMVRGGWTNGVTYRYQWFEEAGIFNEKGEPSPPWNWTTEDFLRIAQKLTDPKTKRWGTVIPLGGDPAIPGWYERFREFVFAAPKVLPNPTGETTYVSGLDSLPSKQLLQFNHDLVWKYKAAMYGIDIGGTEAQNLLMNERIGIAFTYDSPDWLARHDRLAGGQPTLNGKPVMRYSEVFRAVPFPKEPHGVRLNSQSGGSYYCINPAQSKEQIQATFEWLNWYEVVMGRIMHARRDTDVGYLTRPMIMAKRMPALLKDEIPEVVLPGSAPELTINAPQIYPSIEAQYSKTWIDEMRDRNPSTAEVREFTLDLLSAPFLLEYALTIQNEPALDKMIQSAVSEIVTTKDANIDAIAKKYANMINKGPLRYTDKSITKENIKGYWEATRDFYEKNFPEYYEEVFMKDLWDRVKIW